MNNMEFEIMPKRNFPKSCHLMSEKHEKTTLVIHFDTRKHNI